MAEADSSSEDKDLPASARRLQQAAERGQVARSRDVSNAAAMGAAAAAFAALGPSLAGNTIELIRNAMRLTVVQVQDPTQMTLRLAELSTAALKIGAPTIGLIGGAALASSVLPGGFVFTTTPMEPDFSRISPLSGFGKLFSIDSSINLARLLIVVTVLGVAAWIFTGGTLQKFAALSDLPLPAAIDRSTDLLSSGLWTMVGVLVLAAAIDGPLQWWRHRQRLKMSKQEVREEHKEMEGNPQIRSRLRQRQRQISRTRMLAAVPSADVVITNPTHYSVAIRYDEAKMGAPRVVAKGVDLLAFRIREIAKECGVTLVEAPPLARALYAHVEVDHEVPSALYSALAQVLAYVYQLRHFVPGRGVMPKAPGEVEVPADLDPLTQA